MRLNELPPVPGSVRKRKRLGRGNATGQGTYAGRGIKGQKSRSGPDLRIGFEGGQNPLVRALSRKRGFNNKFRVEYEPINVSDLNKLPAGSSATSESLREAGIAKTRLLPIKILGDGELSVSLTLDVDRVSASARAKIEAAGGSVSERVQPKRRAPRNGWQANYAGQVLTSQTRSEPAAEATATADEPAESEDEASSGE